MKHPNILFIFPDQMRASAAGYAGDPNVKTPNLDRLAAQSLNFKHAVAGCPVCCPSRGSLITGMYPHKHGVFINDVPLKHQSTWIGEAFAAANYQTGYIGKWHLNGQGRSAFIPVDRHPGFDYWKVRECSHDYWDSFYYGDEPKKQSWEGYDAAAQTEQADQYIRDHARDDRPFLLMLSWGPPHNPYDTAPEPFKNMYDPATLTLRPNVPQDLQARAREELAGYYAHISALDSYVGRLLDTLEQTGIAENTIVVFWSDHGDMLGSQGQQRKQSPWDESIRVPLLVRHPAQFGISGRAIEAPINTPDLMPTLLGLAGVDIPVGLQGLNYAPFLQGQAPVPREQALISCYVPFGEWTRKNGGREYRGIRTERYTYVRTLDGPWLLYDNQQDPYQLNNLIEDASCASLRQELDRRLQGLLAETDDPFEPAEVMLQQWGWQTNENLTARYTL